MYIVPQFYDGPRKWETHDGPCLRRAPITVLRVTTESGYASGRTDKAVWPRVTGTDWCGEWQQFTPSAADGQE